MDGLRWACQRCCTAATAAGSSSPPPRTLRHGALANLRYWSPPTGSWPPAAVCVDTWNACRRMDAGGWIGWLAVMQGVRVRRRKPHGSLRFWHQSCSPQPAARQRRRTERPKPSPPAEIAEEQHHGLRWWRRRRVIVGPGPSIMAISVTTSPARSRFQTMSTAGTPWIPPYHTTPPPPTTTLQKHSEGHLSLPQQLLIFFFSLPC